MKRFFVLFVVLIFMVSAMCLPVFAAESYAFVGNGTYFGTGNTSIPAGYYHVRLYSASSERVLVGFTTKPFYFEHQAGSYLISADSLIVLDPLSGELIQSPYDFVLQCDADVPPELSLWAEVGQDRVPYVEGYILNMTPSSDGDFVNGLSSVVTSDMLSGALDQIVALLPVVVGCIVAFVGIRKGISFLQQIMHSA